MSHAPDLAAVTDRAVAAPLAAAGDRTAALPVELDLGGRHADAIRAWVEGTLGWQPVERHADGLVPAVMVLRDVPPSPSRTAPGSPGPLLGLTTPHPRASGDGGDPAAAPSILLVDDDAPARLVAEVAAACTPDAVLAWPSERAQLMDLVEQVLDRPRPSRAHTATLRIGGSAGGVGTTTVALGVAGLAAWRGAATLAAVRGSGLPVRSVPSAALAGVGVWACADALPGVAGCRAVRLADADVLPVPTDPALEMLVVDAGVDPEVDVLVCRPDRAALDALATTTAAVIVVTGHGPASLKDLRRAADGRRGIMLPWSVRVARAELAGRVPAGLPGSWVQRLRPLLPAEVSPPTRKRAGSP